MCVCVHACVRVCVRACVSVRACDVQQRKACSYFGILTMTCALLYFILNLAVLLQEVVPGGMGAQPPPPPARTDETSSADCGTEDPCNLITEGTKVC